ncbi:MAG: hypothetical protein KKD48_01760 [Nanoarchaeota archaeon]|nr:hypothetical protein [Nanoarchaeota archaeon]
MESEKYQNIEKFFEKLSGDEGFMYFLHEFNHIDPGSEEFLVYMFHLRNHSVEIYNNILEFYGLELFV